MECREQGTRFDVKCAVGDLLHSSSDTEAVKVLERQGSEDEQVECSLEQGRFVRRHGVLRLARWRDDVFQSMLYRKVFLMRLSVNADV